MPGGRDIEIAQHLVRAERHQKVGQALAQGQDEWAAVCFFYSAYHLVRWALREDPVFESASALSSINVELTMAERDVTRHKGRRRGPNGREWGINELVTLLYRPVAFDYERLHQASIDVRYYTGLQLPPLSDLETSLTAIISARERSQLRAGAVPHP